MWGLDIDISLILLLTVIYPIYCPLHIINSKPAICYDRRFLYPNLSSPLFLAVFAWERMCRREMAEWLVMKHLVICRWNPILGMHWAKRCSYHISRYMEGDTAWTILWTRKIRHGWQFHSRTRCSRGIQSRMRRLTNENSIQPKHKIRHPFSITRAAQHTDEQLCD